MTENNKIVPDIEESVANCRCPECPVYNKCLKSNEELLFCSRGNTKCKIEKRG